jgi:hypothetical protein
MIPRNIIQTGPPHIPLLLQSAIRTTQLLHPGFSHLFFSDDAIESFLADHFPEYRAEYHSFRYRIQKYDFFRYLAVYHYGGFYLDLDVFLARDLTPLLHSGCVFSFEELAECRYFLEELGMDWQIGNYAFGAKPGHPFLAAIIENCLRAKRDANWVEPMMRGIPPTRRQDLYILNTTGPGLVSRTLAENPQLHDRIEVLFPEDVCDRRHWHQFGNYGVHHMVGSWRPNSNLATRYLTRMWEQWNMNRVMALARQRGKTRTVRPASSPAV